MDTGIAILISIGIISVIAIILCIVWGTVPDKNTLEAEVEEIRFKYTIELKKIKVLNKLIVKEKKERILNEASGSGFIYNGFGKSTVDMSSRVQRILVVYDAFTDTYHEVEVTVDTYYSTKVGDEVMFDSEEFIHYEYRE